MPERTLVRPSWLYVVAMAVIAVMAVGTHRGPLAYAPPWSQVMFGFVMFGGLIALLDATAAERRGWKSMMRRACGAAVVGALYGIVLSFS